MTVVGEYHYSALGLFITIFGVVLAAVKVWNLAMVLELEKVADSRIDCDHKPVNDWIFGATIYGTSIPYVSLGRNSVLRICSPCR